VRPGGPSFLVRANSERETQNHDCKKARTAPQHTEAKAQISYRVSDRGHFVCLPKGLTSNLRFPRLTCDSQLHFLPQMCAREDYLFVIKPRWPHVHSSRSKTMGSIASARRAGIQAAIRPRIAIASSDRPVRAFLSSAAPAINAPYAWGLGYEGSGIGVAVIDSGISDHDDLRDASGHNRIAYQANFASDLLVLRRHGRTKSRNFVQRPTNCSPHCSPNGVAWVATKS
jgi:subtilisin family serine protease